MDIIEKQKFDKTLMPWIGRIVKMFAAINKDIFKEKGFDINKEQILIIKHLIHKDGLVQNDLAHITEKDKTTLTRLINKMEVKGLVKRVPSEEDHRCNKIYITDLGREKFNSVFPIFLQNAKEVQENLSEEEINYTLKVLKKITNNLKERYNEIK